jgi:hypothetical protein
VAVTGGKLAGLEGATTRLKVGRGLKPVALFDWFRWLDEDSRHVEDIEGAQLHEGADRFARDELIPFGVVGMTGALDSYEETSVDGTLFLDVSGAKGKDAPVVMAPSDGGDVREVAGGYRALMKTLDQA